MTEIMTTTETSSFHRLNFNRNNNHHHQQEQEMDHNTLFKESMSRFGNSHNNNLSNNNNDSNDNNNNNAEENEEKYHNYQYTHFADGFGLFTLAGFFRLSMLFCCGILLSILLTQLLNQHQVFQTKDASITLRIWISFFCGIACIVLGVGFPLVDRSIGFPHKLNRDWPNVFRCLGLFVGLNYAGAKIPNVSNVQLSCALAAMAVGLWYLFDRTRRGFAMAATFSFFGTASVQALAYFEILKYTDPDFFWVRSWIPCVMFAGGICFGNFGRQLAITGIFYIEEQKSEKAKEE